MSRRSSRPKVPPPTSARLAIGYGPGAATDARVDRAQSLIMFGLSAALTAVLIRPKVLAFDVDRSNAQWWWTIAFAVGIGALLGWRVDARSRRSGAAFASVIALMGSVAWIALFNTGDPRAVEALTVCAVVASVSQLLTVHNSAGARPNRTRVQAATAIAVPAALGAAISAVIAFISPDVVWATVAGVGGAIALLGSLLRLRLPDAIFGPRATAGIDRTSPDATPTAILCGLCLGPILASVLRFEPYLSRGWQVGPRYLFLTLALGAVLAGATAMSINWYHESHRAVASQEATALAVLAAGALALAAASDTLPGTVIAGAVAAGVACVALTLCAAVSTGAAVAALIAAAATSLAWDGLVRSLDGTSNTLAIAAAPCLVFGITSMLGERSARKVPALTDATPTETASKVGSPAAQPVAAVSPSNPSLAPARSPLLEVRGVTYSYGSVQALFGVDLDVFDGEVTAVVGANGAGKTTFLRTISGLATPSAGSIRFGGRNLAPFAAADRVLLGINQIAAGAAVAEDLTVSENLAMFAHTLPHREARAGRDRALEVFPQLRERLGQRASSMSGGERQILALSKALMLRPRLLIVDELSLGLAPIVVSSLIPIIARLHAEGAAVLLVEQSVSVALDLADVASCMERGRIVYTSSAEELRADTHLLEAAYLEGIAAALEHRGLQV